MNFSGFDFHYPTWIKGWKVSVDYLNSIIFWAKSEELQKVIPDHSEKYKQIILNVSSLFASIASHHLSFATSFIVCCFIFYGKSFMPYDIIIFGRWWNQLVRMESSIKLSSKQKKSMDLLVFSNDGCTYFHKKLYQLHTASFPSMLWLCFDLPKW